MNGTNTATVSIGETLKSVEIARNMISKSFAPAFEAQASLQRLFSLYRSSLESIAKPFRLLLGSYEEPKTMVSDTDKPRSPSFVIPKFTLEVPIIEVCPHPFWEKRIPAAYNAPVVNLPHQAIWENVKIQFESGYDISVCYKNKFKGKFGHEVLGLVRNNTKEKHPDKQWVLLQQLAVISANHKLTPTVQLLADTLKISPNNCEKVKQKLADKLCVAFGIEDSPFSDYLPETGYRTRFKLQPEQILRDNRDPWKQGTEYNENMGAEETKAEDE